MIDRHYGHFARDSREYAIALLDTLSAAAVDVQAGARRRLGQPKRRFSRG
jgi:hypothetical protein